VAGTLDKSPPLERLFAVASQTIIAPAAEQALEQARQASERQAYLDGYEIFRRLKDDYQEEARPSADDVESVLSVLSAAVSVNAGQLEYQAAASTSRGWQYVYAEQGKRGKGNADKPTVKRVQRLTPLKMAGQGLNEGRTWYLRLSPGVVGLRCEDANKKERAQEREKERARKTADASALSMGCSGCPLLELRPLRGSAGEIREWSARSRSRMAELVGSLDYSEWTRNDGTLVMNTLTLPDRWQEVAADGPTFKKLLRRYELRWRRNVGEWRCLWKLEFQGRGAPHWHALMRVPALVGRQTFEEWNSETWADVVGASEDFDRIDDKGQPSSEFTRHLGAGTRVDYSGKDFSDPRRISMYFLGHSAKTTDGKEYQHKVPVEWQEPGKGPGRFWGNPGLKSAAREIEITERDAVELARVLRDVKRGRAWTVKVLRERGKLPVGERHKHHTFSTELRQRDGQKRGRAAKRSFVRNCRAAAEARGETYIRKAAFRPSSLGQGGYAVGGWVLVNDALALGLDLARYFEEKRVPPTPADNLGRGSVAERWRTVQLCRAARAAAPSPLVPLSARMEA
jgi:hypothetical protein